MTPKYISLADVDESFKPFDEEVESFFSAFRTVSELQHAFRVPGNKLPAYVFGPFSIKILANLQATKGLHPYPHWVADYFYGRVTDTLDFLVPPAIFRNVADSPGQFDLTRCQSEASDTGSVHRYIHSSAPHDVLLCCYSDLSGTDLISIPNPVQPAPFVQTGEYIRQITVKPNFKKLMYRDFGLQVLHPDIQRSLYQNFSFGDQRDAAMVEILHRNPSTLEQRMEENKMHSNVTFLAKLLRMMGIHF